MDGAGANKIYKRKLEDRLLKLLDRKEMLGVRGARQVGKTTLLQLLFQKIQNEEKAFINLDLPDMRRALEDDPLNFVRRFKKEGKRLFLFLDEIQRVKNAGEKLKLIYDHFAEDVKVIFSGSSSLELRTNVLPYLVGRLFLFELYSFDFEEFLIARDDGLARVFREKHASVKNFLKGRDEPAPPIFQKELLTHLKDYMIFGGYPEVIKTEGTEEKQLVLKNIYTLYLEKDVVVHFGIKEVERFEDFLKLLAFKTASLMSTSSLASQLNISFYKAEEYLSILKHTYIVQTLRPFHRNLVTELRKTPKIYFLDMGIRNAIINNFSEFETRSDAGALLENFVFRELFTGFEEYKLCYWRTTGKAEVDFVLIRDENTIVPVEVKLTSGRLGRSFYSFLNEYRPERALVITLNEFGKEKRNGCTIYRVPAYYL